MDKDIGTPWDFDSEYISPDGSAKLEFGMVGEVAMGAPLSGECFLSTKSKKFKLDGMFGGPAIWNENSEKAALPFWTQNRFQKLAIIDLLNMKVLLSEKTFRVIQLNKFQNNVILGVDSPIYRTEKIKFNIKTDKYSKQIQLKQTDYDKGHKC